AALDRQLASFGRGVFLLIGIGRLGAISSTQGPAVAEKLLRASAQTVIGTVRPDDICARYGEDTFCLLLGGAATDKQGRGVAERIRKALLRLRVDEAPHAHVGVRIEVGFVDMGVDAAE